MLLSHRLSARTRPLISRAGMSSPFWKFLPDSTNQPTHVKILALPLIRLTEISFLIQCKNTSRSHAPVLAASVAKS